MADGGPADTGLAEDGLDDGGPADGGPPDGGSDDGGPDDGGPDDGGRAPVPAGMTGPSLPTGESASGRRPATARGGREGSLLHFR